MSGRSIKISSRAVIELLAGRKTVDDMNSWHQWTSSKDAPAQNVMLNPFERWLSEGRLPVSMTILKGDENEADDWVEFEFGDPDPAITLLY